MTTQYFRRVQGPSVYLSPINPEDYPRYTLWLNDPEIAVNLGMEKVPSLLTEREIVEKMAREPNHFAIVRQEDDALLGNASLMNVDHKHRHAVCGLFIGARENLSRGYGSQALALLAAYGFDELNLHNLMLNVYAFNARAIRCYEKVASGGSVSAASLISPRVPWGTRS